MSRQGVKFEKKEKEASDKNKKGNYTKMGLMFKRKKKNLSKKISFVSISSQLLKEKDEIIKLALYQKDKISFNDNREREILKIILKKPSKWRKTIELMYLRKFFQDFNTFSEMAVFLPKELIFQLFRQIQYIEKFKGDIIFKEGEPAKNFFIIIEGEVEILESKKNINYENQLSIL